MKHDRAQARRGDYAEPLVEPQSLVPVGRFQGSRLASGPSSSPYQRHQGSKKEYQVKHATKDLSALDIQNKRPMQSDDLRAKKVARLSSGATVGAAIVEAETSLEREVIFLFELTLLVFKYHRPLGSYLRFDSYRWQN